MPGWKAPAATGTDAERVHRGHVLTAALGEVGEKVRDRSIQAGPVVVLAFGRVSKHIPHRPPSAPGRPIPAGVAQGGEEGIQALRLPIE
jgi:hypothetical protein